MKRFIYFLPIIILLFAQCSILNHMDMTTSDDVTLNNQEDNAVFLAVNHVDILKIKGLEFYHLYIIILTKDPNKLLPEYEGRAKLFYSAESRNAPKGEIHYFNTPVKNEHTYWETTISASSECGYDTTSKKLGNLIKVPNYDRMDNDKSGQRVFVKKIASNDIATIKKLLNFEEQYDNSLDYALLPEATKNGYNSNSFCRGALKYAGLLDQLEVPNCFKSPGLSKTVTFNN